MKRGTPNKKRVLMVAPTPFFADRGCHVRILGETRGLMAAGHEVLICTYGLGADVPGIATTRTVRLPWYRKLAPGPSMHKLYIDLLLLWKVLWVCRRFRPDVIHAHLHEGIVVGKVASSLFAIPLIADLQGSLTGELLDHKFIPRTSWLLRSMYRIERRIDYMPEQLVVSSTRTRQLCMEEFGCASDRITTLIDGVDLDVFSPRESDPALRAALGIRPHEQIVAYIGVLAEYQGVDLLLEAIPAVVDRCPNTRFLIMGYPNEDHYRKKARTLGVERWTCFTGRMPYDESPRYLSLADVAVSPKVSDTEANGKLFTYMAMGIPSVVFDTSVNREILGDLGVYARMKDPRDLARALTSVLEDPAHARALGEQSRQKAVRDYSWLAVGRRLSELYDSHWEHGSRRTSDARRRSEPAQRSNELDAVPRP
jgi:glycosyltransferase involved in cell wall biosynthesis